MVIDANVKYKNDYANIIFIMGIGQIGAIALLHLFLKYPEANQRQITSLTGVNPVYKQSGTSIQSGYKISKSGAKTYRGSLFMAMMSAVMRKLIITAHSLYKNDRKYDVNYNSQEAKIVG